MRNEDSPRVPCACGCGAYAAPGRRFVWGHNGRRPLRDRFEALVDRSGGPDACHPWLGRVDDKGYGRFDLSLPGDRDRPVHASRVAIGLACCWPADDVAACHDCPDGDEPACCNPRHLWYGDRGANNADMAQKGRAARGGRHHWARLTDASVARIFSLRADGLTQAAIAHAVGCSQPTVSEVLSGRSWRHLRRP